jgi:hypothetical protein
MVEGVGQNASETAEAVTVPRREHIALVWLLISLGGLIGFVSVVAIWLDRVALHTDNYVDTTGRLLDDPTIQDALSTFLVDELYTRIDVAGEIREQLPQETKSLAPIIAGGGREAAVVAAQRAFEFPRVQSLWREANRDVHRELLLFIDDESRFGSSSDGAVTLDVRPMVIELANRVGLGDRVAERLPAHAGNVVILQSDELEYARTGVNALRFLANWLWIFAFVCWGVAVLLARSWRREVVRNVAISFVAIGIAVIIGRAVAGSILVDELVRVESNRAAAESAWSIVTSGLRDSAVSLAIIGAIGAAGTWLAGPGEVAVSARRAMAPYIARPGLAFGSLAVAFLALVWWAPIPGARSPLWLLVFGGLAFAGLALLRRRTVEEHPAAKMPDMGEGVRGWITSLRGNRAPAPDESAASLEAEWLSRLERLQGLRERGALSEEEFQAQKATLMEST